MKLPCAVTRDLLPLYQEDMVEPETKTLVAQHLADCPACQEKLCGLETSASIPVETAAPLKSLKKQIRRRRLRAALIAALCVFVLVYAGFYQLNDLRLVPWEDGLVEVAGIEQRPRTRNMEYSASDSRDGMADMLILMVDSRVQGTEETLYTEDDGTTTALLQCWSSGSHGRGTGKSALAFELAICPVPDRLIYTVGSQQELIWGKPMDVGVEILPRLALGYYALIAAALAALSGLFWLLFRRWEKSWILRQIFFAPLSYLTAHLLIKGLSTTSYFMGRDLLSILLVTAALYALFTLAWQIWRQSRRER